MATRPSTLAVLTLVAAAPVARLRPPDVTLQIAVATVAPAAPARFAVVTAVDSVGKPMVLVRQSDTLWQVRAPYGAVVRLRVDAPNARPVSFPLPVTADVPLNLGITLTPAVAGASPSRVTVRAWPSGEAASTPQPMQRAADGLWQAALHTPARTALAQVGGFGAGPSDRAGPWIAADSFVTMPADTSEMGRYNAAAPTFAAVLTPVRDTVRLALASPPVTSPRPPRITVAGMSAIRARAVQAVAAVLHGDSVRGSRALCAPSRAGTTVEMRAICFAQARQAIRTGAADRSAAAAAVVAQLAPSDWFWRVPTVAAYWQQLVDESVGGSEPDTATRRRLRARVFESGALALATALSDPDLQARAFGTAAATLMFTYADSAAAVRLLTEARRLRPESGPIEVLARQYGTERVLRVGVQLPDLALPALDDSTQRVTLASLRGRMVLLDFWGSWCPPCVDAIPRLEAMHEAYRQDGFTILSVSVGEPAERTRQFIRARGGMRWLHAIGGEDALSPVLRTYGVSGFPSYTLVGPDGRVLVTGDFGSATVLSQVDSILRRRRQ